MPKIMLWDGNTLARAVMERKDMSMRALARRCGVSPATVCAWLDGRAVPTDSHGLTLAALLGADGLQVLIGLSYARTDSPDGRAAWRTLLAEHSRLESETCGDNLESVKKPS